MEIGKWWGFGVSLLTIGLDFKEGSLHFDDRVIHGSWYGSELREKGGNSCFSRQGSYECLVHMFTRTRNGKPVYPGHSNSKFKQIRTQSIVLSASAL